MLNLEPTMRFLEGAANHYEKLAPTVCAYLNDLYGRINERPDDVRLSELFFAHNLYEEGNWMQANYAANRAYKLMARLGIDVTGQAGF